MEIPNPLNPLNPQLYTPPIPLLPNLAWHLFPAVFLLAEYLIFAPPLKKVRTPIVAGLATVSYVCVFFSQSSSHVQLLRVTICPLPKRDVMTRDILSTAYGFSTCTSSMATTLTLCWTSCLLVNAKLFTEWRACSSALAWMHPTVSTGLCTPPLGSWLIRQRSTVARLSRHVPPSRLKGDCFIVFHMLSASMLLNQLSTGMHNHIVICSSHLAQLLVASDHHQSGFKSLVMYTFQNLFFSDRQALDGFDLEV